MAIMRKEKDRMGTLRSWLRHAFFLPEGAGVTGGPETGGAHLPDREAEEIATRSSAVVLPFPIQGDALLVRLAEMLRQRFGTRRPLREPFLFEIVRGAAPKLFIDSKSHATFVPQQGEFRFEFEVKPCTDIVIRTEDFDTLVEFIVQYVVAQLAERSSVEVAS